ncbi:MAG: hypothetical protein K2M73_07330 [Lachnospiraceae bacterium]|nr:hypothetical protein [Lachnospiraceae bacterium]
MAKHEYDTITKEDIIKLIKRSKLPILTLDKKWHNIFNNNEKSDNIKDLEEKVNLSLKNQGHINTKRNELKGLKKKLMKEIVSNMDAEENSRARKKVTKSKELIEDINDELLLLESKELDVPVNLNMVNAHLGFASLEEMHDKLEDNEIDIENLDRWIEETRIELKKRILLREKKRDENEKIEKYIIDTFHPEVIREYRKYREDKL